MSATRRPDDPETLRQFKTEFFKALAHPMRIQVLELLRQGPLSVGQLQEAIGAPASSISQQLAILRARSVVATERRGTTVIYTVRDPHLFDLLDVARGIFNSHLAETIDMLRMVDAEQGLIDAEHGLINAGQGLADREQGLVDGEQALVDGEQASGPKR